MTHLISPHSFGKRRVGFLHYASCGILIKDIFYEGLCMACYIVCRDKAGVLRVQKIGNVVLLHAPNTGAGPYNFLPGPEVLRSLENSNSQFPSWEKQEEQARRIAERATRAPSVRYVKNSVSWAKTQIVLAQIFLKIFRTS